MDVYSEGKKHIAAASTVCDATGMLIGYPLQQHVLEKDLMMLLLKTSCTLSWMEFHITMLAKTEKSLYKLD